MKARPGPTDEEAGWGGGGVRAETEVGGGNVRIERYSHLVRILWEGKFPNMMQNQT